MANVATRSPAEGLEWVRKELTSTFGDARTQLQKFADHPGDTTPLDNVTDLLHMAHGALRMVEVYGAALLVEEMVAVSRKISDGESPVDEGLEVLSRAIVQLPTYLDRVAGGGHDVPLVLLPLLNDLRAVRGSPLLSESSLFVLNIDQGASTPKRDKPPSSLDYKAMAKKLRPHYQKALLGWLRNEDGPNNLARLGGVAAKLEAGASASSVYQFWWILGGVIESVQDGGLPASAAIKRLLGQADGVLKKLAVNGEKPFVQEPPRSLVNNLLYYVAQAESEGKRVSAIKNSFSLSELLEPGESRDSLQEKLQGPSVELMKTVGAAIKQDVGNVKDAIDVFVRTQSSNHAELKPQRDSMTKLGDTLGMLGLDALRQQMATEARRMHTFIEDEKTDDDDLLQVAAVLINVEDAIDGQLLGVILPGDQKDDNANESASEGAAAADRKSVSSAVLRECVVNLTRIKEMLSQYVDNPDNGSVLDTIPKLVIGIRAGLGMLEKDRASELLSRIEWHIDAVTGEKDIRKHTHELDRLADAIVSIEYYMETVRSGRSDPWYMLDNAERCLESIKRQPGEVAEEAVPELAFDPASTGTDFDVFEATGVREASRFNASNDAARRAQALEEPLAGISGRRVDPELLELFIEEAKEEVSTLRKALPRWKQDLNSREVMLTMRRSFHTLKGSGRMVGAMLIGEYAWSFENLVNKVVSLDFDATPEVVATLEQAVDGLPALIEQLEVGTPTPVSLNRLMESAWELVAVQNKPRQEFADEESEEAIDEEAASDLPERVALADHEEAVESDAQKTQSESADEHPDAAALASDSQDDTSQSNDPKEVAQDVLGDLEEVLDDLTEEATDAATHDEAEASLELLEDVSDLEPEPALEISDESESSPESAEDAESEGTKESQVDTVVETIDTAVSAIVPGVVLEEQPQEIQGTHSVMELSLPSAEAVDADDLELSDSETADSDVVDSEPDDAVVLTLDKALRDIFLKESLGHLTDVRKFILDVAQQAEPFAVSEDLHRAWHTLSGSANTANVAPLAAIATPLNHHLRNARAEGWPLSHQAVGIISRAADQFEYLVRGINVLTEIPDQSWLLEDIETLPGLGQAAREAVEALEGTGEVVIPNKDDLGPGYDSEIAAIFAEEAVEILEGSELALTGWFAGDSSSSQKLEELLRHLHTLKGGARMAGISSMGDLSHETESLAEHLRDSGQALTQAHEQVIRASFDELHAMTDQLNRGVGIDATPELLSALQAMTRNEEPVESAEETQSGTPESAGSDDDSGYDEVFMDQSANEQSAEQAGEIEHDVDYVLSPTMEMSVDQLFNQTSGQPKDSVDDTLEDLLGSTSDESVDDPSEEADDFSESTSAVETEVSDEAVEPQPAGSTEVDTGQAVMNLAAASVEENKTQDKARIDARLLDDMLNNAGEVSIFHSRLEEQVGSIAFNLTEHQQTVLRLREQLRKLEIETEAQILHRHQDQTTRDEEFDPLELDRYSGLQQLSRALAESVSDLASLQDLMTDITRESESLLVQQARVTGELQDALIRSRMLPFSHYESRFERIVRQAASEQHKQAVLVVTGASGELDRQVLQRMLPPFEHMLRNAVIHGIESVNDRLAVGKSAQGTINIDLTREGAEMVIRVSDDGRGLNADRLVAKARKLGVIDGTRELDERAAFELIFAHGFSTASSVTQSAGRGVGMDVVASEVKELGGSIQLESEFGQRTVITIRLPLTLAVSHALLVRCGSERFAIPLPAVQGVVRAASDDVLSCLEADIEYAHDDVSYSVRKLAPYLGGAELSPESLEGQSIPLILVRAGDQSCAFLVDEMLGSREVVVKSAGPMVSSIAGVAGATILGDGSIVVILDVASLIRNATDQRVGDDFIVAESNEDLRPVVLVVDDSITVRRVTQRLLERNDMKVLLAKDGVDAVAAMQEQIPDCVLLDIEMPRMDGYEVASHIRNTDVLQHVPICMITSRVGEKHRARAFELGVDKYLGKPYQENQLLEVIQPLLARSIKHRK
ncbi:MAG: Hpt domain-containing protein [Gammaproteobacteria bacterium]